MEAQTGRYRLGLASNLTAKQGMSGGNDTISGSEL